MENKTGNTSLPNDGSRGNVASAAFDVSAQTVATPVSRASLMPEESLQSSQTPPITPQASSPRPPRARRGGRARLYWIIVIVAAIIVGSMAIFMRFLEQSKGAVLSQQSGRSASDFGTLNIPLNELSLAGQLVVDPSRTLSINGQLKVNNSFIVTPTTKPTSGVAGQIYYDQSSNKLAYFNGGQFVDLLTTGSVVNSIGGTSGSLTLGTGLAQTGNTISNSGVLSVQGQTGAINFTSGPGLSINGTTLSSTGVLTFGGKAGDITIGTGLAIDSANALRSTGVQSLTSSSASLVITNDGANNLTISNIGAGTGTVTSGGGTAGRIAKFTGAQNIEDSLLSESGTTVTVGGNLSVTGTLSLTTQLSVANGGTGATTLSANGVLIGNGTSAITSAVAGSAGQCFMSTVGTPTWQACPGGSGGVTSLNGLTGALTVANASAAGSTVAINDASTSQKGIAQFDSTNFNASGGVINTIQNINTSAAPAFGQLTLTSNQASAAMLTVNNTNTSATGDLVDLQLNGSSKFAVSPGGNLTLTGLINGQTISSAANLTGTLAVASNVTAGGSLSASSGTISNNLSVGGILNVNTITPTGALTVGATSLAFTLQGNASSTITATGGGFTTALGFTGTPTGAVTYNLDRSATAGTYTICTTAGNCSGVGGGVTTPGGTTNKLAKFTASQTIADSIITDNGSVVTIAGTLAVNTITPGAALTIGATGQNLTMQGATVNLNATSGGVTNSLVFATPATSNKTITLPNASGTVAVSASGPISLDSNGSISCPSCLTAGGSNAVESLNGLKGVLTVANASAAGSTITINDASTSQKGIAQFNSTNFSASGGVINTVQNINASAAPTFGQLSLSSSQASAAILTVNNTNVSAAGNLVDLQLNGSSKFAVSPAGALTLSSTINGQTISSSANFTGTLGVTGLATLSGGATVSGTLTANTLTPTSALTVGAVAQSFTLQGNASSTLTSTDSSNTTTVAFQTPTANVTYRLLTAAAGTYDICTTVGNCSGVGGGVTTPGGTTNKIAKFTAGQTIGDSIITDNGSTVTIGGILAVNTITPTGALAIGSTGQNLTMQGAGVNLTATSGGVTNSLTFATPATSNKTITIPNATGTLAVSATGPLALDSNGNLTCPTCVTSGGGGGGQSAVDSLDGLTGALTIANSSGTSTTITIDNASTSQKGIAQFNSTNFSVSSGAVNTIQNINTSAAPTFGQLTLSSSQASAAMLVVNNTNASATGNLIDLQLNGSSKFAVTPAGNLTVSGTVNGQTISSAANLTGSLNVAGAATLNSLGVTSDATVGGNLNVTGALGVNTITPTSSLTVGATSLAFTLQGNASSTITATGGGFTTTVGFTGTPVGAVNYNFDRTPAAGTYSICTTAGNCSGVGGGVTTPGGTTNKIAKFTASQTIADSIITDNGSTVTIGGTLAVNTITPSAALTVGATSQNLTLQGASVSLSATSSGITNSLTFATPATSNKTITLPNATGTVAVSASGPLSLDSSGNLTCPTCLTSGGSNAVQSLNGLTGNLTLANASGAGSTVTINDASTSQKGIAQFSNTNFSVSSGTVNTIQNINTTAAPTFGQLTLSSSQASAAMLTVNNTNASGSGNLIDLQLNGSSKFSVAPSGNTTIAGTLTSGTVNGQTISSSANFTGTVGIASTLNVNTITPTAALTVGATGQTITVQGNASSTFTATNASATTTLAFQTPTANVTYRLLTASAGTYDICTSAGNCSSSGVTSPGGTSGKLAKFTGSQTIGDSLLSESGTVVTIGGQATVQGGTSTAAFQVQNAAGRSLLNVDTSGSKTTLGNITSTVGQGVAGTLVFADGTNDNFGATLNTTTLTASRTISLPNEAGTICLQSSTNCGFALSSGSTNYIQNQSASDQTASFRISGSGRANTSLLTPLLDTAAAGTLSVGTTNATSIALNQNTTIASGKTLTVQGTTLIQADSTSVFNVQSSLGNNAFTIDNVNNRVGIGLGGSVLPTLNGQGLEVRGALRLSGLPTDVDKFTTPLGANIDTKINIPLYNAANFSQIIAFGLNASSSSSARGMMVADARSGSHQPTVAVLSPDEANIFGLSWDGGNTTGLLKATTSSVALQGTSGGTELNILTAKNFGASDGRVAINQSSASYTLDVAGDINTSTALRIGGTSICDSTGCTAKSGSSSYIHNQTTLQSANMFIQASDTTVPTVRIEQAASGTADVFDILKNDGSTKYVSVDSSGNLAATGNVGIKDAVDSNYAAVIGGATKIYRHSSTTTDDILELYSDVGSTANLKFKVRANGDIFTDGSTTIGTPADLAENYPVAEPVEAGDVVIFKDGMNLGKTTTPYDNRLAGVVSTRPGLILSGNTSGVPLAMKGHVPVKVTAENGAIAAGDSLTASATHPGYAMKATSAGMIIGTALEPLSNTGTIEIFLNVGYNDPGQNVQGSTEFQDIQVQGTLTAANINVTGSANINTLNVTGTATIATLHVTNLVTAALTVNGHIISGGNTPTVAAGAACAGASATVAGTDTAGLVTLTAPNACTDGVLTALNFAQAFAAAPRVSLTPANASAASANAFVDSAATSANTFTIATPTSINGSTTYKWYYQVIQ